MNCDWNNQRFINTEMKTITYSNKFCDTLVENFLEIISDKYLIVFKLMLLLDEWVYLTCGIHLILSATNRAIYRRYMVIIKDCEDKKDLLHCANFCREFNLNRFTYMFDGEIEVITEFMDRFEVFSGMIKKEKYFRHATETLDDDELDFFAENHSINSNLLIKNPLE